MMRVTIQRSTFRSLADAIVLAGVLGLAGLRTPNPRGAATTASDVSVEVSVCVMQVPTVT